MSGFPSTYHLLAWIVIGAMALVGLGLLFVRAQNIERTNLVAVTTLAGCLMAGVLLWRADAGTPGDGSAWTAIGVSLLGFGVGRLWDVGLGGRRTLHRDPAVYNAELSD